MKLKDEISYLNGDINYRVVAKNASGVIALVAFDRGTATPLHMAEADVLLQVLEGAVKVVMPDAQREVSISEGEFLTMSPATRHTVSAEVPAKVLLTRLNSVR
ncbi:MAG: hypothetical protein K2F77_02860 [Muribaculaceae bacterium]|nr:hypothetical protein [Muribaculaceae bacterium]